MELETGSHFFHTYYFFSDVIRLLLLHLYGGWYSDLDIVFVKDVTKLENVVASDNRFDTKHRVSCFYKHAKNELVALSA